MEKGVGVKMTQMPLRQPALNGLLPGRLFLQNLPSLAVGHLLNPSADAKILDLCASPGGKTTHLASLAPNGEIWAVDKNAHKTAKILENCRLLGIENVKIITADSTKLLTGSFLLMAVESFDYVVLDPPCSGLGLRPNLRPVEVIFANLEGYAAYQEWLFEVAWKLLKPGGQLIYSTCTVNPLENEILIDKMLHKLPDASLLPIRNSIAELCLPGLQVGQLTRQQCEECLCRFWPSVERDTNGFFIAKFLKRRA